MSDKPIGPDIINEPVVITYAEWANVNDRLTALENARDTAQRFAPGRIQTMYEGDLLVIYGMATEESSVPDVYFLYNRLDNRFSLCGHDGERPITIENITAQQIRHLIGAALEVLKRMEAE